MNHKALEKLLNMLPEGPRKMALQQKLNKVTTKSQKRGGDGLHDLFEFKPKGHIMIEEIDSEGKVVGVLADQDNLVVDGAEEILLRAFSGDPNRILYKNRTPKSSVTEKIYIENEKLGGSALIEDDVLLHAPNVIWSAVDDEDFEVSYAYYPKTLYIKEEESVEVGKKAFTLSADPIVGYIPIGAEIYSSYSNLFIGIGEGKNYAVDLTDPRLTLTEEFTVNEEGATAAEEGAKLSFKEKISNFKLELEASDQAAQVEVSINGIAQETIELRDDTLTEPEVRVFEYDNLNYDNETEVVVSLVGASGTLTIKGLHFDALSKNMNTLIKEFGNFEVDFETPSVYHTTEEAPYTIQLPNFPVKANNVVVQYNELTFTEVQTKDELDDVSFLVDEKQGKVQFNRALTGLNVQYSVTGEINETKLANALQQEVVVKETHTDVEVDNQNIGTGDGFVTVFALPHSNIKKDTLTVKVDDVEVTVSSVSDDDKVTLAIAPNDGAIVTASYTHVVTDTESIFANKHQTEFAIKEDSVSVFDHNGVEMTLVEDQMDFADGCFMIGEDQAIIISQNDALGELITKVEFIYKSDERPGVPTGYTRAVIEKPKTVNDYPWFDLDKGSVRFVAEFPEIKPTHDVTIREMGLFDGPRVDDNIAGFKQYPVKAFSLVRVGETRKDKNTGIRITWTISLINSDDQPFQGGRN